MHHTSERSVKIFYLNQYQEWLQYAEAQLSISPYHGEGLSLNFLLVEPLSTHKLPILPLMQIFNQSEGIITIAVEAISKMERLDANNLALNLQEWNRIISISFRDEEYCLDVEEQIELELSSSNQLPCRPSQIIKYIANEMNISVHIVDWVFQNQVFFDEFFKFINENTLSQQNEKDAFRIIKNVFMRGNKPIMQKFLNDDYYHIVLKCLSFNFEFGDRRVDYLAEYLRIINCRNVLGFKEEHIISSYGDIMKARYLMDYPTSMFLQPNTQMALNEIIRERSLSIISILIDHPSFLSDYRSLSTSNPVIFVQLFCQLWEMFKLVIQDSMTNTTKTQFHSMFIRQEMLLMSLNCISQLVQQGKSQNRLYQKFLQSLNPFLSYKWFDSQQYLINQYKTQQNHLAKVLLKILTINDYHTKTIVLTFARYLIEVTQNRRSIKQSFMSYVFTQFIAHIHQYFHTAQQIEALIGFYLKCYKVDHIRGRRCIISSNIISLLQQKYQNKYILIVILRFLRTLLQVAHEQIFIYLQRHQYFYCLRSSYFQAKKYSPNGIAISMFVGLLKDCERSNNKLGIKYIYNIMNPQDQLT